ncbi:MAG: sodium-dependent transporter, partial [Oscillospiraceae bacterium]
MEKKNQWSSNLGFILATAGAAVGLGNLWKFPYLMGKNGGFPFFIAYIVFIALLGIPLMITETAIGRKTASAPIKAYKTLDKRFKIIGVLGILSSFIIMSYYSVIGGWVLKYVFSYVFTQNAPNNFNEYIASPIEPLIWFLVFILCAFVICLNGTKGIEKATKFMMPALLIMLIIIVIRSLTLGGSVEGLKFIFLPESGFTMSSISAALGQVFYSLSLCMGITITYGSYLSKKDNIVKSTNVVAWLDSFVAILAGLAIFPAVFSFGLEPSQGPGLTFGTLPNVFSSFSGGWIF